MYIAPTNGYFTVTYSEENKYTYHIDEKTYRLKTKSRTLIEEGQGTFPGTYHFDIELDGGFYVAEQTIYWWELGVRKSKTASCEFKLISPKPAADFRVDMKMTNTPTWRGIDVPGETGKCVVVKCYEFKNVGITERCERNGNNIYKKIP